jgi:hypothetical protein
MMKSITGTMLTSTMSFGFAILDAGDRSLERSDAVEITDPEKPYAGFHEKMLWRTGLTTRFIGEGLVLSVNWLSMKLGYYDGEVSGMAAWPAPVH